MSAHGSEKAELGTSVKLRLFSSPLVKKERDGHHYISPTPAEREDSPALDGYKSEGEDEDEDYPVLRRHEEPTLLEIFYDLFFAATYNAFCDAKQVTSAETFKASIGYFCLLWLTWLAVTLFEVRYATDSIFSRVATAVQLGVLIGFVVVAPQFDPSSPDQDYSVMRSMSFILTVSRVALVVQYTWILTHLRKHKESILPLAMQTGIHAVSAVVYLGIAFAFKEDGHNRVYMTWYFISGIEGLGTLAIGMMTSTVSFVDTHLMKRMALLTVMILGEGIESMAKKVLVIVKNPEVAWDNITRGQLAAAAATIYFVFLVYFDWLGHSFNLPRNRQSLWIILHLPFHLALVLFMQGFIQLLIWGKIASSINKVWDITDGSELFDNDVTGLAVAKAINASCQDIFKEYPPKTSSPSDALNEVLTNITKIPDNFWTDVVDWGNGPDPTIQNMPDGVEKGLDSFGSALVSIANTLSNAIFSAFGIDLEGEVSKSASPTGKAADFQLEIASKNWDRYALVFAYTYIAAGCAIILLLIIKSISSAPPKSLWARTRIVIIILLAIGTALTSLLWYAPQLQNGGSFLSTYLASPWVAPTICVVWTILVILTHINLGPFRYGIGMLRQKKAKLVARRAEKKRLVSRTTDARDNEDA